MLCAKFGWNWASGSGEEDFLIFSITITFSLLSPLGKGRRPSFEESWIPSTQGCSVPSLVEISPVVLEKKLKMWKVYRRTDRQTDRPTDGQTDNRQKVIRKAHLSFQWAEKNCVVKSNEDLSIIWSRNFESDHNHPR